MEHIVKCEIRKTLSDPSVMGAFVWFNDCEDWKLLFTYYPDEITILEEDLIGLTEKDALNLYWERELEYLRS